ncbi:MAG: type II secretion system F family protein [Verrucomicrobiaceae bacterium]|nr:type II secretion system F family protein [Verrucomicrobiaceae bacterium]
MANFLYLALDAKGEQTTGSVQASSESDAIQQLRSQGLYPTQVVQEGKGTLGEGAKGKARGKKRVKKKAGGKVKADVLSIFTRQLATLIEAGLPLLRGLNTLEKQEPDPSGATFSESLAQHPLIFNKLFVNMVKAGELGGVLEVVLVRLAEYAEKAAKLKSKLTTAMVYPCIVLFIAVGILIFLLLVVVPKFKEMMAEVGELPLISEIVFGASENMLARPFVLPNAVWLFIILGIFFMIFKAWASTKKGRFIVDTMMMKLPIIGDLQSKSAISRFTRTMGTLVTSGVPILQALTITKDTAGNVVVAKAIEGVHDGVKEGEAMVTPLQACGIFPGMVISMVDVGEETGQLPEMMLKIANVYDDEVDNAVSALTAVIEPIMIVFLAVIVGSIVMAIFLPLIKMMQSFG